MVTLTILTVGRPRRGPFADLEADYLERIQRFHSVRREAVPASGERRPEDRRRQEGQALLAAQAGKGALVALDSRGTALDSALFAALLNRFREQSGATFVVGGPDGLDEGLLSKADHRLSLGPMTLPHDLALVVLLEQVYRALARQENHPYARH